MKRLAVWALVVFAIVSFVRSPLSRLLSKISGTVVRTEHPEPDSRLPRDGSGG